MNGTKVLVAICVGCGLLAAGCGSKSPVEKCEDLFSLVCDRLAECSGEGDAARDECIGIIEDAMVCAMIKSVGSTYDDCLDQLDSRSCPALFPDGPEGDPELPEACNNVLSDEETRAVGPSVPARSRLPGLRNADATIFGE